MASNISRRRFLAGTGAAGAMVALGSVSARAATPTSGVSAAEGAPRSRQLRETGSLQRRWLSIGGSRIVVNPLNFNATVTPVQYNTGPEMPLHVGYYCSDTAFNIRSVLSTYRRTASGSGQAIVSFADDFSSLSASWTGDAWVKRQIVDDALRLMIESGGTAWGVTYQSLTIDVDKTPYVEITVTAATGSWSLKVNDGTLATDIVLQGDTKQVGTFSYDLRAATGWSGSKTFQLRIFAIGVGEPVDIDSVRVLGATAVLAGASTSDNAWLPHELEFAGTYPGGAVLQAADFMYDPDTIARIINARELTNWVFAGAGNPSVDGNVLTVSTNEYSYAIATSAQMLDVAYFASQVDLTAWLNPSATPVPNGLWAAEVTLRPETVVAVGFATKAEGAAAAADRARTAVVGDRAAATLRRRELEWDRTLARVPRPREFALSGVPDHGVTADQVRHSYYVGWVFAAANSLPPMPEVGFHYPQMPAGKPSLWVFGAPGAKATAAWDSLFGQQFIAYLDPDLAWDCFEGLMSLVGQDGSLNGESLPSRKAQTAMVLYQISGDKDRLRHIYPALKRLLDWEAQHLYWIPPGATGDPDSRDSDFVAELLIDMAYARDAATILGIPADAKQWDKQRTDLYSQFLQWFWPTPTTQPSEYFEVTTGKRDPGAAIWTSTSLHLDLLPAGPYLTSLEQRFLAGYDPDGVFCSFVYAKYPDLSYTIYGLLERGMREQAEVLVNAAARDVTRANMFSENYLEHDFPTPFGVRPSLFGDCTIIDMVWLKNGYRMDAGLPAFVRIADTGGGIDGLRIRGKTLNIALDPAADTIRLSGSLVNATAACQRISAPLGQTVPLPTGCATG